MRDLVEVYRRLAARGDYALHLGLTEAGMGMKGIVASSAGLSLLLAEGIGDTIRVSITPEPGGDRTEEVAVAQQVLQSLGLRSFVPQVSSCPGCGRTTSVYFQELARDIQTYLRDQMPLWRERHPGVEELRVAVMGCVVNGPGESKHADIGISLPGTFEDPVAPVFIDGALDRTLRGDHIADEFKAILDSYVERRFPAVGGALRQPGGRWRHGSRGGVHAPQLRRRRPRPVAERPGRRFCPNPRASSTGPAVFCPACPPDGHKRHGWELAPADASVLLDCRRIFDGGDRHLARRRRFRLRMTTGRAESTPAARETPASCRI